MTSAGGQVLANLAVTALDSAGRACFTVSTKTDLIVDVLGWFGATGLRLQAQTPQRVVDTRGGIGGVIGPLAARGTVSLPVANQGMLATVTAVQTPGIGFLTAYPCGPIPYASNLNYAAYDVIANLAVVPPGQGARACVMTSAGGQVLVDKAGTLVT